MSQQTVVVLNGPNLNLLGEREPEIYGSATLDDIAGMLEDRARELGLEVDVRQSNHEGHLVDWLHEANAEGAKAVLLNAGAGIAVHTAGSGLLVEQLAAGVDRARESIDSGAAAAVLERWSTATAANA